MIAEEIRMNEKLSALMDGELDRADSEQAISRISGSADGRNTWDAYHLLGEVLRGEPCGDTAHLCRKREALFARLADEPTVIAPGAVHHLPVSTRTRWALAAAASIATVSSIGLVALKQQQESVVAPVQLVQAVPPQPVALKAASQQDATRVNDYLVLHRQFAVPAQIRQVSNPGPEAGHATAP